MSVRVMALVLSRKVGGPTRKLILLKLADCADDEGGRVFPALETIADQTETARRTVIRTLQALEKDGIIIRQKQGGGRHHTTLYRLDLGAISALPEASENSDSMAPYSNKGATESRKGATESRKGATVAPEPSLSIIDPPTESAQRSVAASADDVQQAFDAWNATAAEHGLVQAKALNPKRRQAIKARLTEAGGIDAWQAILATIPQSPFLMGQTLHAFRMDLDFVLQPSSFIRLMEGKYLDRKASAPLAAEQVEDQRRRRQRLIEQGVIQDDDAGANL